MQSPFPRLVGDIGGTNARFALVHAARQGIEDIDVLPCAAYPQAADAITAYLAARNVRARSAALGIATPVEGDAIRMTNHHWQFSVRGLRAALGLERLVLLNDFTAMALGVASLEGHQRLRIGTAPDAPGPMAVLGPGTGLGVSGLLPSGNGQHLAIAGEGGHATLAASTASESEVLAWLRERHGHVSAERVLSGPGLVALCEALAAVRGEPFRTLLPADVSQESAANPASTCRAATDMFCDFLGTVASNLALTLGARGGVFIAGGVVPALGVLFDTARFRTRFESKGRFSDYLARVPTYLVQAPYCALGGAASALDAGFMPGTVDVAP